MSARPVFGPTDTETASAGLSFRPLYRENTFNVITMYDIVPNKLSLSPPGPNSTRTLGRRLFQGFLNSGLYLSVHAPVTLPPHQRRGSMKPRTMCINTSMHTYGMHTLHTHTFIIHKDAYIRYAYIQRDHGRQNLGSRAHKPCFCTRPSRSRPPPFLPRRFRQAQKETATHTHTIPKPAPVRSAPGSDRKCMGECSRGS